MLCGPLTPWVLMEETLEECLMVPIEYVESVLIEDWSEDYAPSEIRTNIGTP